MNGKHEFLKNSVIVAAHPDDELLWFGSILKDVDRVIMVFEDYWPDPSIGPARADVLAHYPRQGVSSLKLPEAATYGLANWDKPVLSPYGVELGSQSRLRDAKQRMKRLVGRSDAPAGGITAQYETNFATICDRLREELRPDMNVFTHNPWGEYGHEEHIQVFRALDAMRIEIGFKLWMSNYCTERALPLAMAYFGNSYFETVQLPVDRAFADKVADAYRRHGCWTWAENWNWFETEMFMEAPSGPVPPEEQGHLFPLNMFNIGVVDPVSGVRGGQIELEAAE